MSTFCKRVFLAYVARRLDVWHGLEKAVQLNVATFCIAGTGTRVSGTSPESQRHCVESMQGLIDNLIRQGVVAKADPQALASLIYGSLAEAALWIAADDDGNARLERGMVALDLLLCGLLIKRYSRECIETTLPPNLLRKNTTGHRLSDLLPKPLLDHRTPGGLAESYGHSAVV